MKLLFINNDGGGFADTVEVEPGTTISRFFQERLAGREPAVERQMRDAFRAFAAKQRRPPLAIEQANAQLGASNAELERFAEKSARNLVDGVQASKLLVLFGQELVGFQLPLDRPRPSHRRPSRSTRSARPSKRSGPRSSGH